MQIRWWPGSSQRTTITCTAIYYSQSVMKGCSIWVCFNISIWLAILSQQCWDKAMCWSTWAMLLSESRVRRSGASLHLSWKFLGWVKLIFWELTISEDKYTCTTIICNGWQLSAWHFEIAFRDRMHWPGTYLTVYWVMFLLYPRFSSHHTEFRNYTTEANKELLSTAAFACGQTMLAASSLIRTEIPNGRGDFSTQVWWNFAELSGTH